MFQLFQRRTLEQLEQHFLLDLGPYILYIMARLAKLA